MKLFKHFTDITHGVRRLGAAAIDICHVACGKADVYWEYDIKPWDIAAGILIAKEAGAKIDKNSGEFENLLTNLKDAIFNGDGAIFGELNFEDLPTVEYSVSRGEIENDSWAWDAPESKETEPFSL